MVELLSSGIAIGFAGGAIVYSVAFLIVHFLTILTKA